MNDEQNPDPLNQIEIFPEEAEWNDDFEDILQAVRLNSEHLSLHHQKQYVRFKILIRCFRIPTILLSSVAAVVSAGFLNFIGLDQSLATSCILNLIISTLAGLELFLGVERNMAQELQAHRAYLGLAYTTAGLLRLTRDNRPANAAAVTDRILGHHELLLQSSSSAVGFVHSDAFTHLKVARKANVQRRLFTL